MKFNSPDIKEKLKPGIKDQLQIGLAFIIVGSLLLTSTLTFHYIRKNLMENDDKQNDTELS
jgi:hypothetical protein